MSLTQTVLNNLSTSTPPENWRLTSRDYRKNMKFNADRFAELCAKRGYDPAEVALNILKLQGSELKPKEHLDAVMKLMEFAYPKQRAVEIDGNLNLGLSDLLAAAEAEWQARKSKDS